MKIVAFGASFSKQSINRKFAGFVAQHFDCAEIKLLDLNNYKLPVFTVDLESEIGYPETIKLFLDEINDADLLIISMAEHNGSYTAAFKNLFDWASRFKKMVFESKKILLLSASTGKRGGMSVLEAARIRFPIHGAEIIATFSLPNFEENFDNKKGIINSALKKQFEEMIAGVKEKI